MNDPNVPVPPSAMTVATVQSRNWDGCVPIQLTLAPTSVSSPTIPPPIHVLVSRNTYLHVGLRVAVERLQSFALILSPSMQIQQGRSMMQVTEPDPGFKSLTEEEGNGQDLAHQMPSTSTSSGSDDNGRQSDRVAYPVCWFEDEETKMALRWQYCVGVLYDMTVKTNAIPWRIKLHFTNYPSSQILPFEYPNDIIYNVHTFYKHSLKQAMAVVSGNSKSAMNVTKESHGLLWDAITNGNCSLYQRVDLKVTSGSSAASPTSPLIHAIPIRVFLDATNAPIQRRIDGTQMLSLSLGQLLHEWLPEHFMVDTNIPDSSTTIMYKPNTDTVRWWKVCGIVPPLSTNIYDLWRNCSHPDHFLYIIILTR